jgi:hypothetical protein
LTYDDEGMPKNSGEKLKEMRDEVEEMEPASDLITLKRWESKVLGPASGQSEIFALTNDLDQQIFAAIEVPETYFKPKGTTDRMVSEGDKTFIGGLKEEQVEFAEMIEEKILYPALKIKFPKKKKENKEKIEIAELGWGSQNMSMNTAIPTMTGTIYPQDIEQDPIFQERVVDEYDEYEDYPRIEFDDITKTDITQEIANTTALLQNGIITKKRAAQRVGERYDEEEMLEEMNLGNLEDESTFTELRDKDMNHDERNGELSNPQGKFKRADNKVSKNNDEGVGKIKEKKKEDD